MIQVSVTAALRVLVDKAAPFSTLTLKDRTGAAATAYADNSATTVLAAPITADASGMFPPIFVRPALWGYLRPPLGGRDWPGEEQWDQALPGWFGFLEPTGGAYQLVLNGAPIGWAEAVRLTTPLAVAGTATGPATGPERCFIGVGSSAP